MLKPFIFVEINRNKWGFHLSTMCTCVTNGGALSSSTVPRTHVYYNLHNKFFWLRLNHFLRVFLMAHRVHCESATRIRILCVICRPFSKLLPREFNQHKSELCFAQIVYMLQLWCLLKRKDGVSSREHSIHFVLFLAFHCYFQFYVCER